MFNTNITHLPSTLNHFLVVRSITVWSPASPRIPKQFVSLKQLSISRVTLAMSLCWPSSEHQRRIKWFVDAGLNRWRPQCWQIARQGKGFTSPSISPGQQTHSHNMTGSHSSKWLHSSQACCLNGDLSSASREQQWHNGTKKGDVSLTACCPRLSCASA